MAAYITIILAYILFEILMLTANRRKISFQALKKTHIMKGPMLISLVSIIFICILIIPNQEKSIKFGEYWNNIDILQNQRDVCLEFDYLRNRRRTTVEHPVYLFLHPDVPNNEATSMKIKKRVKHFRRTKPTAFVLVSSGNPNL